MASNLCQSSVKITVAQICQSLGWNSIMATPLDLLIDIMERYLTSIGRTTQKYSEQFGRSDASYGDSLLALTDMGVCLPELLDYMKNVDPVEFPKKMPAFPAPKSCKLIYADDTGDGDAPGSGRSPLHSTSAGESLSSSILAVNRRSLTTSSPDQLRPLQELGNSEFRARCRQLLDSDGTDVEERLSKAPDPRPPLQMAQIMRQRRPALSIPPISISGVTTSVLVLNSGGSGAEAARQLAGSDLTESFPVKVKKDRSAQAAPATASKSSSAKRSKAGGSKAAASAATSKASSDPKRREKAAVAKQRKRDQGYNALAEALTAAPLQCSSATSVAAAAQPATDWLSAPAAAGAPSRSASRHAAVSAAHEPPIAAASAGASSRGSSRSASPASGPSRRPRGITGAPSAAAAAAAAATMRHLDDTFDAVIRGGGGASSGGEDAGDRDEEEVDVDVEELNLSHEQLASPPPHLLPLSTASFAPLPHRPPRGRSTIDDVIDSVARGDDIEVECGVDGSEQQAAVDDRDSVRKRKRSESGEERPRKRKKKKSKARSKPSPPLPPSLADTSGDAARGEPAPEEVECHADVDSFAGSPEPPPPPAFASSPAASPEPQHELLEVEVVHEPAADEPSINIVDDDIEVVHEVEVEHDVASVGPPPLQAASGVSIAGERRPPSLEDASFASGNEFAATLPAVGLGDEQLAEALLPGEAVAERKEKHKKEKKEKKKKKNKERHRDRRHAAGDDDAAAASPSSSAKLHGHKERSKGEKERRHKHHHQRTDGSGGDSRDSERKREQHSGEHRHKVKDKRAAFAGSDGEQKREPELAAVVEAAVSTAPVPKLLFKIAGKTISTVSQAESGGSGAAPVASLSADRLAATQASSVAAAPLPRKKPTEIYTETEFTGTREVVDVVQEADDNKVWICPGCHHPDDGSPMIGCDKCEDWYHWTCVGIVTAPPDDATWYCPKCATKKPPKKKAKH